MELVLYYSTGDARMKKQEMMMKSVLVRMGVKIRNVARIRYWKVWDIWQVCPDLKSGKYQKRWKQKKNCLRSQNRCW